MYGADPKFFPFGTKTGGRRLFAEEGVPHPLGVGDVWSEPAMIEAMRQMRRQRPAIAEVVVKLNEAIAGEGNAIVDLSGLPAPGDSREEPLLQERFRSLRCEMPGMSHESYCAKLAARGGIVEERITASELRSPSVQMRATPLGELEVLSTHDQLLGGAGGQSYLGCRFPADREYAALIVREARKVGHRLVREGVLGRFAVDFVVARRDRGNWDAYAIEINLRKGGTTHPFLTLQFLTDGAYDPEQGIFLAPNGQPKFFVASDHLESTAYRALAPDDLFDIAVRRGLHFDQARQTGIVFHMLATLAENGRFGAVAIGNSPAEADQLSGRMQEVVDEEARLALAPRPLPAV
jgi:hypothetical protein